MTAGTLLRNKQYPLLFDNSLNRSPPMENVMYSHKSSIKFLLIGLLVALLTNSCTTLPNVYEASVEELMAMGSIQDTQYDSIIIFTGARIVQNTQRGFLGLTNDREQFYLRSFESKNQSVDLPIRHQLYAQVTYYGNWRYYDSANKVGGDSMEVESLSQDVLNCRDSELYGCSFLEIFSISISVDEIEKMRVEGLNIRVNTDFRDTYNVFNIPATVFEAHLTNIQNYLN